MRRAPPAHHQEVLGAPAHSRPALPLPNRTHHSHQPHRGRRGPGTPGTCAPGRRRQPRQRHRQIAAVAGRRRRHTGPEKGASAGSPHRHARGTRCHGGGGASPSPEKKHHLSTRRSGTRGGAGAERPVVARGSGGGWRTSAARPLLPALAAPKYAPSSATATAGVRALSAFFLSTCRLPLQRRHPAPHRHGRRSTVRTPRHRCHVAPPQGAEAGAEHRCASEVGRQGWAGPHPHPPERRRHSADRRGRWREGASAQGLVSACRGRNGERCISARPALPPPPAHSPAAAGATFAAGGRDPSDNAPAASP